MGVGAEVFGRQRDRSAGAEVFVVLVERGRVARREELRRRRAAPPRPTVRPTTDSESVAGGLLDGAGCRRDPVAGGQDDPARVCRRRALPRSARCRPAEFSSVPTPDSSLHIVVMLAWPVLTADDDAAVGGDVAVGGEPHVDDAVQQQQAGALHLVAFVERHARRVHGRPGDRHREAGRAPAPVAAESACRYQWAFGRAPCLPEGASSCRSCPVDGSTTGVEVEPMYGCQVRASDRRGLEGLAERAAPLDRAGRWR